MTRLQPWRPRRSAARLTKDCAVRAHDIILCAGRGSPRLRKPSDILSAAAMGAARGRTPKSGRAEADGDVSEAQARRASLLAEAASECGSALPPAHALWLYGAGELCSGECPKMAPAGARMPNCLCRLAPPVGAFRERSLWARPPKGLNELPAVASNTQRSVRAPRSLPPVPSLPRPLTRARAPTAPDASPAWRARGAGQPGGHLLRERGAAGALPLPPLQAGPLPAAGAPPAALPRAAPPPVRRSTRLHAASRTRRPSAGFRPSAVLSPRPSAPLTPALRPLPGSSSRSCSAARAPPPTPPPSPGRCSWMSARSRHAALRAAGPLLACL